MAEPHKIWIEQCDATGNIEDNFGVQPALHYLIGEKFLDFLDVAEFDEAFKAEIPAFVARLKTIFERWQLAAYLDIARESEPFDPLLYVDSDEHSPEDIEDMRKEDIQRCARDLLLVERAREWLLEDSE